MPGHDHQDGVGDDRGGAERRRLAAGGAGGRAGGDPQAAPLPRADGAGAARVLRALGGAHRGAVGRPDRGRDLSLDDLGRQPAAADQPAARRRGRHRLDRDQLHARPVPAHRGVRAAVRARRRRGRDQPRDPGPLRRVAGRGVPGRPPDPDPRPRRQRLAHHRHPRPQARGSRRSQDPHAVAHRQLRARGARREPGRHAGAAAAPGALQEGGRRHDDPVRDLAAAQDPRAGRLRHGVRGRHPARHRGVPLRHEQGQIRRPAGRPEGGDRPERRSANIAAEIGQVWMEVEQPGLQAAIDAGNEIIRGRSPTSPNGRRRCSRRSSAGWRRSPTPASTARRCSRRRRRRSRRTAPSNEAQVAMAATAGSAHRAPGSGRCSA